MKRTQFEVLAEMVKSDEPVYFPDRTYYAHPVTDQGHIELTTTPEVTDRIIADRGYKWQFLFCLVDKDIFNSRMGIVPTRKDRLLSELFEARNPLTNVPFITLFYDAMVNKVYWVTRDRSHVFLGERDLMDARTKEIPTWDMGGAYPIPNIGLFDLNINLEQPFDEEDVIQAITCLEDAE